MVLKVGRLTISPLACSKVGIKRKAQQKTGREFKNFIKQSQTIRDIKRHAQTERLNPIVYFSIIMLRSCQINGQAQRVQLIESIAKQLFLMALL